VVRVLAALDIAPALWGGPWIPVIPVGADAYEADALRELTSVIEIARPPLEAAGLTVETDLVRGTPALAIPDEARAWKPDLTVVGSRGQGALESALLGSVSSAVVDHADSPVLVARGDHVGSIVLAEDGSPAGIAARDLLVRWSPFAAIPVRVVGVVDMAAPWRSGIAPTMFSAATDLYAELIASSRESFGQVMAAAVATLRAAGRTAEAELREGDPADQLVQAAHDVAGDLIVIGSRGHTGISRIVMGSVAHSVLLHAHCSVLVLKQPHQPHH
jgi:nucleotide-binding universal stress UspA family protein